MLLSTAQIKAFIMLGCFQGASHCYSIQLLGCFFLAHCYAVTRVFWVVTYWSACECSAWKQNLTKALESRSTTPHCTVAKTNYRFCAPDMSSSKWQLKKETLTGWSILYILIWSIDTIQATKLQTYYWKKLSVHNILAKGEVSMCLNHLQHI